MKAKFESGALRGEIQSNGTVNGGAVSSKNTLNGGVVGKSNGTYNYEQLKNQPQINSHVLIGDQTSEELEIEVLKENLTATRTVGGVTSGDEYEQGVMLEQILRDILNPLDYPTLTDPSASIQSSIATLLETGDSKQATLTVNFNRGSINPAYGTSGYRSGIATEYTLKGISQSTNQFTQIISEQNKDFTAIVSYAEGEQPVDSKGNVYDSPLPAGSVISSQLKYEFVDALWASTVTSGTVTKQALLSKSVGEKIFDFPPQTASAPEIFDVPASWTIRKIEVYNDLTSRYEDCSSEFTMSATAHENAGGEEVNYNRYTDNRGYAADSRRIKITWA